MPGDESLRHVLLDQREELKQPAPSGKWVPRTQEHALRKGAEATRCRDLLLLTPDGSLPREARIPRGLEVQVQPLWRWLLE